VLLGVAEVQQMIVQEFMTVPTGDALYMADTTQEGVYTEVGLTALRKIVEFLGNELHHGEAYMSWLASL